MAQAYDAIIATIVVAGDATSVTKTMVKSTTWRAGTSGDWLSTDCTLTNAGNTYQFRTPLSGMSSVTTAVLPNIKASVIVAWDTTATAISTVGNYFMYYYAYSCTKLTSLSVPDTSELTSVGDYFMAYYARYCTSLTSLSVPDTSGLTSVGTNFMYYYAGGCSNLTSLSVPNTSKLTSVGDYFMAYYARYCTSLTSLSVPDTSGLTSVGNYFMRSYAYGCSNLTSLSVPDTSGLITEGATVGTYFMTDYAYNCTSLTKLILPADPAYFEDHNKGWSVPSERLNYLKGYVPNATSKTAWEALTAEGKTLYLNYIRDVNNVLIYIVATVDTNSDEISLASLRSTTTGDITVNIGSDEALFTSLATAIGVGLSVLAQESILSSPSALISIKPIISLNSDEISLTSLSPSLNVSVGIDSDEISLTSLGIDSFSVSKDLTAIAFSIVNPAVDVDWDYLFINKPKNITNWSSKSKNSTTWIKRPKVLTNWEEI